MELFGDLPPVIAFSNIFTLLEAIDTRKEAEQDTFATQRNCACDTPAA